MSDRYRDDRTDRYDRDPYDRDDRTDYDRRDRDRYDRDRDGYDRPRPVNVGSAPLPDYLTRRLLREGEEVTSVRGPRWCPSWERYVTHPAVFLGGLAAGLVILVGGGIALDWDGVLMTVPGVLAVVSVVGSLIVVALAAGYWTRLVITTDRVMIVQGYEVRKTWKLDDLPRWLVRHSRGDDGELRRSVDMEKLTTMMGGGSDGFTDAKSIWALGKELDRSKREGRREERWYERRDDRREERWGDRRP